MNSLHNFLNMMGNGHPEWLPFDIPLTEPVAQEIRRMTGVSPDEAFDTDFRQVNVAWKGNDPGQWREALASVGFQFPASAVTGPFGMIWVRPPLESLGCAVHLLEMLHPLSNIEDVRTLERLPWPDTSDPAHYAEIPALCDRIHSDGKVASGACECTIFEHTWYLRGMENVFCDWAEENPVTTWLLDYFTERSMHTCQAYVRAGCDMIRLGDDVATQGSLLLSVDMWKQHLKPRLKKVIDAIRETSSGRKVWIQYHSDGAITPLIEELIELGVDILNPVQPECVNLEAVAAEFGKRIAFSGMIGTQTTMPFGTPEDVRAAVARCRRMHEQGARVIVAPTHVLEPDVPMENIRAFAEAAAERLFASTL